MVLVFDLDDTLYEELSFVRGGFMAAARYAATRFAVDPVKLYNDFMTELNSGRGKIFDNVLRQYGIYSNPFKNRLVQE